MKKYVDKIRLLHGGSFVKDGKYRGSNVELCILDLLSFHAKFFRFIYTRISAIFLGL